MSEGFPRLVTRGDTSWLVLEQPETGALGLCVILRLDGEPTTAQDVANVLIQLMHEEVEKLAVPWRDY